MSSCSARLRAAVRLEVEAFGERDGELIFRVRAHEAGRFAARVQLVPDGERLAPEVLPAEQPVAEAVVDGLFAKSGFREIGSDARFEVGSCEAVEGAGVD